VFFIVLIQFIHGIKKLDDLQIFLARTPPNIELEISFFRLLKGVDQLKKRVSKPVGHNQIFCLKPFKINGLFQCKFLCRHEIDDKLAAKLLRLNLFLFPNDFYGRQCLKQMF
jgi:hypothetical protein